MSYLRCTHCGAKALSAASQCPRCTRAFDLHDASGMRVALRACRGCGFMHRIDRACAGCGEIVPRVRMDVAWARGAAAAALALTVAGAAWRWAPSVVGANGRADDAPVPLVGSTRVAGALMNPAVTGRLTDGAVSGTGAPPSAEGRSTLPASPESPASLPAASPGTAAAIATARGDSMAWVPAVARTWVNVRSDASRGGEVVGVIKPSSRAMLGSNRAGWRQVRSSDATGWVDPRLFAADSTRPRGE